MIREYDRLFCMKPSEVDSSQAAVMHPLISTCIGCLQTSVRVLLVSFPDIGVLTERIPRILVASIMSIRSIR